MKKILGLESFSELKETFGDIYCKILWGAVGTSLILAIIGKCYDALYSTAIELFVFTLVFAVMGTISSIHTEKKVDNNLSSLPKDEKDLLIYIYEHSKDSTNAVYVPYDNAVAISLKYKRILRRYDTIPTKIARKKNLGHKKDCFLYGIRERPRCYIEEHKKDFQIERKKSCTYLNKYQYIDEGKKGVEEYLKSLSKDEKDLLFYIYDHAKNLKNAVYVPYDNAVAISLKYKRILRRYKTNRVARRKNSEHNKYCFLYGIRKRFQAYVEDNISQFKNLPSAELRAYLDKYQYIDEDKIRYIAYGSNLSVEQMAKRCPDAKIVGTKVLKGWKLVFRGHANIEPCSGSEVPVLIWEISKADEKRLDKYEDFPNSYVKKYLPEGMVYIMAEESEIKTPDQEYLNKIKSGYEKFGFEKTILEKAVNETQS